MSPLDRRSFVTRSLTVLGGAAAPAWLARAFGFAAPSSTTQDPVANDAKLVAWRKQQLAVAMVCAKAHGKPLLVLVVPEVDGDLVLAGRWFGGWLTNGDDQAFATFGLCTLACARLGEAREVLGLRADELPPTKATVTMLVVDAARAKVGVAWGATAIRIEPALPILEPVRGGFDEKGEAVARGGFRAMTDSLRSGLDNHGATLPALAVASLRTLDVEQQQQLDAWVRTGEGASSELLERGLAELQLRIAVLPEATRSVRAAQLTTDLQRELRYRPVAGSRWESALCGGLAAGSTKAGEETVHIACGMGRVEPLCQLFLDFYSVGG
jgi:hypothetical protein